MRKKAASFVTPDLDDALPVDAGGYFGVGIDLDGSLRSESQYIAKYREMAMHPEVEQAVEDICNEAIVHGETERYPVSVNINNKSTPDTVRRNIEKRICHRKVKLLDFNNKGFEIFEDGTLMVKGYYHMIVDKNNTKKGVIEMRPIDASKIKKIAKVEKQTGSKN